MNSIGYELPDWYKKYNKHHIRFMNAKINKTCSQCLHYIETKKYCNVWESEKHAGNSFNPKERACYLFEEKDIK